MKQAVFIRGMILGLVVGTAACLMVPHKKKSCKSFTGKILKTAGAVVENLSDALGL